jgi:2-polyprenyl-3-methyl-5-hydroxy-6-metoxy-1,4-benzoquinol methylase
MTRELISKLYNLSLRELVNQVRTRLRFLKTDSRNETKIKQISLELQKRFSIWQVSNLKSISAEEFTQYIYSKIGETDFLSEGYQSYELERQRDLSIKFHWGHNHDFGDFKLEGKMGNRHINLLANFVTLFPVSLEDFRAKEVFDIGCWTGGTTLLLASLGARVFAIEEVKKYAEMVSFLVKSFGIESQVSIEPISIYDCNREEFYDRFDIVYFPGVVYHLSDPVLALRILFNSLKLGGVILVESAGINRVEPFCRFEGGLLWLESRGGETKSSGWNWFIPSPSALYRMMREAGFDQVKTEWHPKTKRIYGYGKKVSQVGILKAGLSVPSIK